MRETVMGVARAGRLRSGRILLWAALALSLVFLALAVWQKYYAHCPRFVPDSDLLDELAGAVFEPPDDAELDARVWPQWRGQRRDGVATAADLLTQWPSSGPKRLWRSDGGDGYSSFAVAGGAAYSTVGVGDDREAVVCWDVADGKECWRRPLPPGPAIDYGGPRATPTLDGNRLFTVSSSGVLTCLDTADGKVVWDCDLCKKLGGRPPKWGFCFSPLVKDGRVFAVPGGDKGRALAAFARDDGKLLWAAQDDPPGYSSPVALVAPGVSQILFFTGQRLVGVTPEEGKLRGTIPGKHSPR